MVTKRLLIVEDDPRSMYAFHAVLQARGYEAVACDCAESALKLNGQHFDAAIIDVRLPKMQGSELAIKLRQIHPSTRIIFVTAYEDLPEIRMALPGSALLVKPIDMDMLLGLL